MTTKTKTRDRAQAMREFAERYGELEPATTAWLASLDEDEKDAFAFPYARAIMRGLMRAQVRQIEHEVFGENPSAAALLTDRYKLLDQAVFVPSVGFVLWGDLTPALCRDRADWLREKATSDLRTADELDCAADLMEQMGVSCLREIRS